MQTLVNLSRIFSQPADALSCCKRWKEVEWYVPLLRVFSTHLRLQLAVRMHIWTCACSSHCLVSDETTDLARGKRAASSCGRDPRSEEHTSELQSLMRIS